MNECNYCSWATDEEVLGVLSSEKMDMNTSIKKTIDVVFQICINKKCVLYGAFQTQSRYMEQKYGPREPWNKIRTGMRDD